MLGGARASSSTMSVQSFSVCTVSGLEDEEREGCAVEWDGSGGGGGGWDADGQNEQDARRLRTNKRSCAVSTEKKKR